MYYKQETGELGEDEAEKYLVKNNYEIIERNFKCIFGEIDIIAKDLYRKEMVFIEVKTRNNELYGVPAEAVDFYKKKHIIRSAKYFIHVNELENEYVRMDVIEVYINKNGVCKINHIEQAFC